MSAASPEHSGPPYTTALKTSSAMMGFFVYCTLSKLLYATGFEKYQATFSAIIGLFILSRHIPQQFQPLL